ncbi:MAG: hypothetical protein ABR999_03830 [Methanoregula sp.]|jgi:hypothetical protein|uniref:hypothetical protein n=1 Tax=Methanoregula sp. TaxID=2052170 RepID=UPI003D119A41
MMIKIDHIALASHDFRKTTGALGILGYSAEFCERGVPNLKIKEHLLSQPGPTHDLSLLRSGDNLGIELLDHGSCGSREPYIRPVFENVPSRFLEGSRVLGNGRYGFREQEYGFDADITVSDDPADPAFHFTRFRVPAEDLAESARFWEQFGFRTRSTGEDVVLLEFSSSLHRKTFRLELERADHVRGDFLLDDAGFNCIAIVSTSPARDRDLLAKKGIAITGTEHLLLAGKNLTIAFCTGPCGEPVEIIGYAP